MINYLTDYIQFRGQVSQIAISPENAFIFLCQRYKFDKIDVAYIANPGELGTVLLLASSDYSIDEEIDSKIIALDRCNFHLFIPENIKEFSLDPIETGQNLTLQCGFNFWNIQEFKELCLKNIELYMDKNAKNIGVQSVICCIASSFLQPNRLPLILK